eukprot:scaffold10602_cov115-Isochrysis_galbana.AAC.3
MDLKALTPSGGCGRGIPNLTVSPTAVAPYEFAVAKWGGVGSCLGGRVAAFPIEVAAAFGGDPLISAGAAGRRPIFGGAGYPE